MSAAKYAANAVHPASHAEGRLRSNHERSSADPGAASLYSVIVARKTAKPKFLSLLQTAGTTNFIERWEKSRPIYWPFLAVIAASVVCYLMENAPEFSDIPSGVWVLLEAIYSAFFALELILRYFALRKTPLKFFKDPLIWLEFMAITPFFATLIACGGVPLYEICPERDHWTVQLLCIFKLTRVFKVSRQFRGTKILIQAFRQSLDAMKAPMLLLGVIVVAFATVFYYLEAGEWIDYMDGYYMPDGSPPKFTSIYDAAYYCVITYVLLYVACDRVTMFLCSVTTVGYGDKYPVTTLGKFFGVLLMIIGVLFMAMPISIIGNEFFQALDAQGEVEIIEDSETKAMKVFDFSDLAFAYTQVGESTNHLLRYLARSKRVGNKVTETDVAGKKYAMSLISAWVQRHSRFLLTVKALTSAGTSEQFKTMVKSLRVETIRRVKSRRDLAGAASSNWIKEQRERIHAFLDDPNSSPGAYWYSVVLNCAIMLNVGMFIAEYTHAVQIGVNPDWGERWIVGKVIDILLNCLFFIEFTIGALCAPSFKQFVLSGSFLPEIVGYVPFLVAIISSRKYLLLYLFYLGRIFKMARRWSSTKVLYAALRASIKLLVIPLYFLMVFVLMFGAFLYLAERGDLQQDALGNWVRFNNGAPSAVTGVIRAGWVMVVTMTTTGYGDVLPLTYTGKFICSAAAVFGLCYLAMPIAIVGNSFYKAYEVHMKANSGTSEQSCVTLSPKHSSMLESFQACGKSVASQLRVLDAQVERMVDMLKGGDVSLPMDPELENLSIDRRASIGLDAPSSRRLSVGGTARLRSPSGDGAAVGAARRASNPAASQLPSRRLSFTIRKVDGAQPGAGSVPAETGVSETVEALPSNRLPPLASLPAAALPTPGASRRQVLPPIESKSAGPAGAPTVAASSEPPRDNSLGGVSNLTVSGIIPAQSQFDMEDEEMESCVADYLEQYLGMSEVLCFIRTAALPLSRTRVTISQLQRAEVMFQRVLHRKKTAVAARLRSRQGTA